MNAFAKRLSDKGLVDRSLSDIQSRLRQHFLVVWFLILVPLRTWRYLGIATVFMLIGVLFEVAHYDDLALGMGGGFLLLFLTVALLEVWWPFVVFVRSLRKLSKLLVSVEDELWLAKMEAEQLPSKSSAWISGERVSRAMLKERFVKLRKHFTLLASERLSYDVVVGDDEGSLWGRIFSVRIDAADIRTSAVYIETRSDQYNIL